MRRTLTVVAASAVALVGAAAPAGAKLSKKAYFDVTIAATQQVYVDQGHRVPRMCGDGIGTQGGNGSSDLTFDIGPKHWVAARRVPGDRIATLQFEGKAGPVHPIGRLEPTGSFGGTTTQQPTGYCPKPEPPQDDCGTLDLPPDSQLGMAYISPATWASYRYLGHPKSMSLVLNGPATPTLVRGMPFKFCPGVTADDALEGIWAAFNGTPAYSGPAPLSLSLLFGTKRSFAIHWHESGKDDQFASMLTLPART